MTLYTTVLQVMTPTPLGDRLESFPLDEEQSDVSGCHLHLGPTAPHTLIPAHKLNPAPRGWKACAHADPCTKGVIKPAHTLTPCWFAPCSAQVIEGHKYMNI